VRLYPFKIPKQVVLPGLVVQVRVVEPGSIDEDGDVCASKSGDFGYDPNTKKATIRLASDLTKEEARYTLIHELQHVMTDYLHVALSTKGFLKVV
jgi:Zn-dependent peptidase ImmA (M78 family)